MSRIHRLHGWSVRTGITSPWTGGVMQPCRLVLWSAVPRGSTSKHAVLQLASNAENMYTLSEWTSCSENQVAHNLIHCMHAWQSICLNIMHFVRFSINLYLATYSWLWSRIYLNRMMLLTVYTDRWSTCMYCLFHALWSKRQINYARIKIIACLFLLKTLPKLLWFGIWF